MNQRDLFRKKIEEKKEKSSKKPRYGMRKLSVGFVSCLVGFIMFLTGVPVMAEGGQSRSVNNEVHYTLAGETDGVLDYARTVYDKEDGDGIHLTVTKWAKLPGSWGYTERGPYNGRYLLNFFDDDFYTQIESIKVNNIEFEKEANGALWKVPINNAAMQSGLVGVVTNNDIVIKLKNGATLTSLGLADRKINFTTIWVRGDGKADTGGYDKGFILKNNDNIPTLPSDKNTGNEYYLGSGLNGIESDGTQSKDGNFTSGETGKVVSYNAKEKAIRSTVSFKPDQNFLDANSGWVLYINEVIPKELLKYIDTDNVRLGVSTSRGEITASSPIKLNVDPNGDGRISTKDTPSLSIVNGDWNKVKQVRNTLDKQVFKGVIGQRRSYTIEYKLKSSVSNQEFAKALNEYITTNNDQLNFESWLTADFVDSTNAFPNIRKADGGKPNKILQNSYSNAFMEVLDTDKDGLYDFTEDEIDTDKFNVDTDGDGVPDGQEVLTDKTNPKDAKSYLVVKPDVTTKTIEANSAQTIVGKVPKTIYDNPADTNKKLAATNTDAGEVIVKAYKYVADDTDYTTQPVKAQTTIPFAGLTDGNFTVNVPAGTFAEADKVILVAYSPDGNNPKVSSTTVRVGAIKVTFDTNGGKWSDGTNADKVVNAVNGTATQPEEPTRDGYQFLGWASTANATAAEAGILNNIEDAKEVFAVWKDNKAPVIGNINDQTVVERNAITEINVTTDDPTATVTVKDLPSGLTYSNGKISGTPSVTSWGNDEKKEFTVTVEAKDPSGNTSTKTFKIIVQRDTDSDGTPDVTDTDDDGDGVPDTVEIAKGSDPKNAGSVPSALISPIESMSIVNQEQTVVDKKTILEVSINPNNIDSNAKIDRTKVPPGLTVNDSVSGTVKIEGSPNITNWGTNEEFRKFEIPATVTNSDGSKVTKKVIITVQRDTDNDGIPDVTDTDDDGDGYTDAEETARGSNPKDATSKPVTTIDTISDQTVVEGNAISEISVTTNNPGATITVKDLPAGVTYDPTSKKISGTPSVTSWGSDETKDFTVTIEAKDSANNVATKTFKITVQRDTDNDGIPDITDTDDDGDGYTDLEESARGSNPKDATSKPVTTIDTISDQTVVEGNAISEISVATNNPGATITVKDLPTGVTYDPISKKISGTPSVTSWGSDETKEFTVTVEAKDSANNVVTRTFKISVQRDTDSDGTPDVTDTDDDGDGVTDTEEIAKGSDPKNPNSKPMGTVTPVSLTSVTNPNQTVIDENAITNIVITPGNTASTVTVDTSKLPNGVTYDPTTKTISGTPDVTDWTGMEEFKKFEVPVVVTNPDGSKVTKTIEIRVERDTDGDGTPDVTDTDDDGDGVTDTEEIAKGSDPKNPNSRPMGTVTPVSPTSVTNPNQTVIDENAITNIVITPGNTASTVTVDTSKLPNGVTYDPITKTISGTPDVTNWGTDETKKFDIPVVITNPDGSKVTKTVEITVQRDTDSDGIPDITDTDDDGDGYTDLEESAKGTDPKDPTSKPTTGISPIADQTVVEGNAISEITVTTDNPTATVTVKDLPAGVTYDPSTKKISGTPSVTSWGSDETKDFTVTIEAKDSANNVVTRTFKITVQRDTDSDGTPDVTDTDDDGDGVTDTEEIAKGSDPKNPNSRPMGTVTPVSSTTISNLTQTVIDENAITNIVITPGNTASTVTVDTSKLPNGVTYDPTTKTISGTPDVTNWGTDETKKFDIPVVITNPDGSKVTKTVEITVQRDTDSDGTPDVTDTDDDGDGVSDTEEIAKGSDPKNPNSRPMGTVTPVSPTTISNPTQTLIDENAITNIVITPGNTASTVTVDTSKLPNGVTYDPTTKTISGTPDVTNWGTDETKKFDIPVVITNPDGSKVTKTVEITVQRDTDGDGIPDITDTDDDGDGYTDLEESAKGTDPKDPTSKPTTGISPIADQTVVERNPINEITVTTDDPSATITVKDLPTGVTYDPSTKKISGTPSVTSWTGNDETKDFTVTVEAKDSANNVVTRTFKITVQRDTDSDGTPDVTDTDDDGDGVTDTEEIAKGSDPKNPNSRPMGTVTPVSPTTISNPTQTVIDENAITNIVITPGNTASTVTVDTSKLPNGVTYDPTTKTISGTPDVTNWGTDETKKFDIPVVITNPDGSKVTKTVEITVQRDTDSDGTPDVTDTDDDGDGVTDTEEIAKGSDPKNPNSRPMGTVTPVSPTTISNPTQTLIDENAITNIVITPGNTASTVTVDTSKLPNGVTYDPTTKTISGTPDVTNWGTDETKKFDIPVVITNPDGSKVTKTVEITVQRDTDGDGTPDVTDTDDDGDGYTDVEENAKGTDPKDPTSVPTTPGSTTITNPTQTVIDEKPITSIVITPGNPSTTITVDTSKLPNGVTYDPTTKTISGTPDVTDWGPSEETRKFEVPVVVQNPDGTTENKKIVITIQRDTDKDGIPDVTDTDDDGDGVTDTEEIAKGSDPKNPNSRPMGTVTPVSPTSVTNPNQTVIDEKPITSIVITPGNTDSTVTVDTSKIPNGVTYDPTTNTISGTPDVTNWGPSEETRKFEVPVVVTNPDGSKTTKTVEIVVQRDTDKDGNPDVTDPDDDNDGVTDVEENAKGTNPKDPNSKPTNTSTQTNNQGSGKKIDTGRIAGKDRIDTAIDISKKLYKKSKAVIIVRSDIFPDSMTASVLARLKDAPILLNPTGQLDSRVAAEIKRLGATEIIIVGGTDSISVRVRDELRAYDSDNDVERIGGKDRYETSELVARKVISITGNKNTAVVASGQVFPDALTVGTFASRDGYPILLVKKDIVPSQIERVIKDLDIDKVYIAGGTDTISKRVEAKLPRVIERMAGRDRYETSVAIARSKFKDSKEAFVASGQQFADALVISPVSGKYNLPTLLVSTNASSNQEVKRYIQQSKINKLIAVGGERYLPSSIIDNLIK